MAEDRRETFPPLPDAFAARMERILGAAYPDFLRALTEGEPVRSLRVNQKKITLSDFSAFAEGRYRLTPIPFAPDGFYLEDGMRMGGDVGHQAGMFYMQEPSAMLPVNAAPTEAGWRVLDLCAAPGGKTSQLSAAVGAKGLVIANDVKFERCRALSENVERLGLENTVVTSSPAPELCRLFRAWFDLVLVDATCSGEGMFRKNGNLMVNWSEKKVAGCTGIQRGLLRDVADTVKPGGYILYSTCTFAPEENEETVLHFLAEDGRFSLCPVSERVQAASAPGLLGLTEARRVYPHLAKGEGQFVALLRKREDLAETPEVQNIPDRTRPEDKERVAAALAEMGLHPVPERIYVRGGKVWILPENPLLLKKNVLSHGVAAGEWTDKGFLPSHAFFMAFGERLASTLPLEPEDERLAAYLRGEDVVARVKDGWGAVTVAGCSIGGYRAKGRNLKNLYPRNLTNKEQFGEQE